MAKKKTSVLLPGGIQGLVHDLQNGKNNFAPKVIETTVSDDDDAPEALNEEENPTKSDKDDKNVNSSDTQRVSQHSQASGAEAGKPHEYVVEGGEWSDNQSGRVGEPDVLASTEKAPVSGAEPTDGAVAPKYAENDEAKNAPARGRRPKENTMREYHIVKDNSTDSWQLFLDMATQYKNGGGKLATIYIDESLKNVLDRMKYAGHEKLSTSAILSSIVARFVYDHEDEIKKVLYSELI